jgi:hydroxymethylbilane synthase
VTAAAAPPSETKRRIITIGTRPSPLARAQTAQLARRLEQLRPDVECREEIIITAGDRDQTRPIPEIGGKGLFTEALDEALRAGGIDAAVHSFKDLPITDDDLRAVAVVCDRIDARDVLIAREDWTLETLPKGARVGTSSLRRKAQLLAFRPDLDVAPLRGNVDTRVRLALDGAYDAIVIAAAGVVRLGLEHAIRQRLAYDLMVPAPAQGALAVICRLDDHDTRSAFGVLEDSLARATTSAERAFLHGVGGGCSSPVAAHAEQGAVGGALRLVGLVIAADGSSSVRVRGDGAAAEAVALGARLAAEALDRGAGALLS